MNVYQFGGFLRGLSGGKIQELWILQKTYNLSGGISLHTSSMGGAFETL
ncbi:hypothetical protein QUF99_08175 [Bacillus sp. DX4.1]|nr:hypothetical protein [Bacillus sp. DX4.1]MDM5187303.1 hypothetical protein [Bacillus sp. DX4.1]